ncbi:MAG TPA: LCP family protein [Acidimicrobiales bacterium]|nr:LCP family protein [Acidimicrobiales bacterium]
MFEHLDDPRPPALGADFRRAVVARGRRRRRHRRMAGAAGVTVASLLVGVGGVYGRIAWRADQIERVDVTGTGPVAAGEPMTVLVLGVDSEEEFLTVTDTIMLARIDPGAGTAGLLSLPRDLMVDAPDGSGPVTINSVVAGAGVEGLVSVVESQVGVPVDHVVQVGFDGFVSLIDDAGGIDVWVDTAVRDMRSGLFVDELGCVTLDGEEALALARSRSVEVLDAATGTWVRDPLSDLRRIETQRTAVVAMASALGEGGLDPMTLDQRVDWALDHLVVDAGLGRDELVRLGRAVAALDPSSVRSASLPVVPHPTDENRLAADPAAAPAVVAAFVEGGPLAPDGPEATAAPAAGPGADPRALPGGSIVEPC